MLRRDLLGVAAAVPMLGAWTGFRGDRRTGRTPEAIPEELWADAGLEELWRRPIGEGYSSIAVGGGRAYTGEIRDGEQSIVALDPASGDEIWSHRWEARFGSRRGLISAVVRSGKGPRATPTWSDGLLYAAGPAGEMVALDDSTGEPKWQRNVQDDLNAKGSIHGVASSPLVVGDAVVLAPGRAEQRTIVALDRTTGELRWGALSGAAAYISPMRAKLGGVEQIIAGTQARVAGLAADSGNLLWEFAWKGGDWAAQPLPLGGDALLLADGSECARVDVVRDGEGLTASAGWRNINLKAGYSSPVTDGEHIYGFDKSFLTCLDPATGARRWKGGRYGRGQLILAGRDLLVLTEDGEVIRVAATPEEHKEVARFPAVEGRVYACPALADGKLFVRGDKELACYRAAI